MSCFPDGLDEYGDPCTPTKGDIDSWSTLPQAIKQQIADSYAVNGQQVQGLSADAQAALQRLVNSWSGQPVSNKPAQSAKSFFFTTDGKLAATGLATIVAIGLVIFIARK